MLLILIAAVWLLIAAFVVVLCRMAARGDRALATQLESGRPSTSFAGLTVFEDRSERERSGARFTAREAKPRDVRARGARCVAGS
jgi:hypothetical protein